MSRYQVAFDYRNHDEELFREEVEAHSFSLNAESNSYEFYDSENNRVFSAPRNVVLYVKKL